MLKLSKKADYGLMALQHIASVQFGDVTRARMVNTKEIAEEYNIPVELLAKVLQTLSKNGLIESHNGPKGGYLLAKSPREVTIAQVLESLEGPLGIMDCSHEKEGDLCNMTVQDMMGGTPLITIQSVSPEQQGVER